MGSDPVELSFGQQRLWFLAQFQSGSAAYNVPMAWWISGALDLSALQRSLDQLVVRHEALRTTFPADGGHPRQVVTTPQSVNLVEVDLRRVAAERRESELARHVLDETRRPFDLATGPVMRAALIRVRNDEHIFILVLHHIVCDGPSIAVLLDELALFYQGFSRAKAVHLPDPPVQYADFAIWQRAALSEEVRAAQLAYWREQLRDSPAELDFPSDRPRPVGIAFRGGMAYRDLARQVSEDFRALARQHGVTRFMALLALFQVLLSRYTGQEDIAVGCPMTHRIRTEVSRVVGFFANMMVLRLGLEGNPTFRELLRRTREVALGAYAHQDLPFEQLVAELQPKRVPGRNPFFQVMLVVEESAWRNLDLAGSRCTPFPVHNGTAKFDFSLYVIDHPDGFRLSLEYDSDLFDADTASGVLEHYENLLRAVVSNPDGRVSALPLLSASERELVLQSLNEKPGSPPSDKCAHRLIEAQAERTPQAIAVRFQNQELTYRQLNLQANQLAHRLVELGAGREVLIAICVERSPDLVIAMLAVMKSGSAYLPLDPAHPSEHRNAILRDSAATILITDQALPAKDQFIVVSLAEEQAQIASGREDNPGVKVQPGDLAYVIYTSGSTGRPKGVQVEHGNLSNFLEAMRKRPGLSANDVLLAVTTVTFDIAVLEWCLPLTVGASIILASRDEVTDADRLINLLQNSSVTTMQATPATWRMLLAAGWPGNRNLKVMCGGEALSGALAHELLGGCRSVWNMYGPTETTIWSSLHRAHAGETPVVPIGRPIDHTTMYVLDQMMEPVPIGVRGELYIGGAGVARGYLGSPRLTAARFVPDPFFGGIASLYRTGDTVRQRRSGMLEFLGRSDRQTKIRGHRIEPAEIETVLRQYPGLQEVAVMVRDDTGENQLVAYVVPAVLDGGPGRTELTKFLRQKLPDYMVPSAFVTLPELPTTPHGKLDWKALPPADMRADKTAFVAPRNSTETMLARIWEEVLSVRPVGATDNFFDLGGHSILATRLLARVEKEFRKRLPLATLFEAPTIEELGAILRQDCWLPGSLIQVQPGDSSLPPMYFVQARIGYHALAAELGPEQAVYIVPYEDLFAGEAERSLAEMAAELAQRIRQHQPHGPYHLGGWCLAGRVAFAIACELSRQGENVAFLAVIDMPAPKIARLSHGAVLRSLMGRLHWHIQYLRRGNREERVDWVLGFFRALRWQASYRGWQIARFFLKQIGRSLPQSLRHPTRLMALAARRDATTSYPGRVTLFRPSERSFIRYDPWDFGWGRVSALGVEVHEIAGLKRSLLRAKVIEVGRQMRKCLGRAQAADPARK